MVSRWMLRLTLVFLLVMPGIAGAALPLPSPPPRPEFSVPILVYHHVGPSVRDWLTVTTPVFESQLRFLRDHGYRVIPLRQLVDYYLKQGPPPPPRSVVITVDDGDRSAYTEILPLARKYRIPVTLFVYPSAIAFRSSFLSWRELRELQETGLFDIQSHSLWHPNFRTWRQRLPASWYPWFVDRQLQWSRAWLERRLGKPVDLLAWPFGIYDDVLVSRAKRAGYLAMLTIEPRHVTSGDRVDRLPRYMLDNSFQGRKFAGLIAGVTPVAAGSYGGTP